MTSLLLGGACDFVSGLIVWLWRRDVSGAADVGGSLVMSSSRNVCLVSACPRFFTAETGPVRPGLIQLKELAFDPTQGCEFYIVLSRTGTLPVGTRMELLQQILREQSVA